MRVLIALLLLAAYAVGVNNHWLSHPTDLMTTAAVSTDNRFVELRDAEANALMVENRSQCGDNEMAAKMFDREVGRLYSEVDTSVGNGELNPDKIIAVGNRLVKADVVSKKCLAFVFNYETAQMIGYHEAATIVLLSTDGDLVVGYADQPTTPWQQAVADDSWQPDTLVAIEDETMLVIELPGQGDPAWKNV
jgi:hypothetical protein